MTGNAPPETAGAITGATLVDILLASLKALADAGRVEAACRLAGQACAALRRDDPAGCQRFNVLLHHLTRRLA